METRNRGITCHPNTDSLEYWCNADFVGSWDPTEADEDPGTAKSRTGFIIRYASCPIIWASKLQTEISLSSTEREYIALSQAMREVNPLMSLVEELHMADFSFTHTTPKVHCKLFEDNAGAIKMAKVPKMRPQTKHLNIKYHHFCESVRLSKVSIQQVSSADQSADMLTKPLQEPLFTKFRCALMGW